MANPLTYEQVLGIVGAQLYTPADKMIEYVNRLGMTPTEYIEGLEEAKLFSPVYNKEGVVTGWNFKGNVQTTVTNPINSNVTQISRGSAKVPISTTIDTATQTVRSGKILPPSGAPSTWSYVANSVASPIIAAGIGISLGKTIDATLYNLNPNFWDSNGMSAINPETWNSLTTGIDYTDPVTGTAASLMNMIFGLNPETGEATAYIDENAYALIAEYLYSRDVFSQTYEQATDDIEGVDYVNVNPLTGRNVGNFTDGSRPTIYDVIICENAYFTESSVGASYDRIYIGSGVAASGDSRPEILVFTHTKYDNSKEIVICSKESFYYTQAVRDRNSGDIRGNVIPRRVTATYHSINGSPIYHTSLNYTENSTRQLFSTIPESSFVSTGSTTTNRLLYAIYVALYGEKREIGGVEGIGTQPNGLIPDVTGWETPTNILPSLQQQYPDIFTDPIEQITVNPDGTTTTRRYVPIPLPNVTGNPDTQPTSGTQTQQDIKADEDTSPEWLTELIAKLIQQPDTDPFTPTPTAPENPIDTGEGESPVPVTPVGSASALWSIYHPTQAQINSFGGWLWSADFIEQLKKIFNNPMESIIGLHKVYATPIDAGNSTIHVGYLDSEVPSAYITQQYITVNCGSVDLLEQFGNVFDYGPFTSVKLYLPFIGIINLDVSEVMRSTISIKYGVDVITGACLAMVSVSRDGNDSILYQFAGNCAVQYPLSMGSYMGIVSSVIGIAGSITATVATGGSVAPLAIGAIGGAMNAHTSVQNSGSFSGNAGAMGGKKPYLIIERPQTRLANNQQSYVGIPTNEHKAVGSYSGFVKFRDVHLTGIPATDDELSQIQSYLTNGVII